MKTFETRRRVRHGADDMFALVADVSRYPEFVPLCSALHILKREDREDGISVIDAEMTVSYKLVSETFVSRVTLNPERRTIDVTYLDGPFSTLDNRWTFEPLDVGRSTVGFFLRYAFRSRSLELLMGAMFDRAFRRFAAAFERRADDIHGRRKAKN